MSTANPIANTGVGSAGNSSWVDAAIAPMSEPILKVFAATTRNTIGYSTHFGYRRRTIAASPSPVTAPMRMHASCTATMSGKVSSIVHRVPKPNCAPACEYVAIPDGSSSAAPVTSPGPKIFRIRLKRLSVRPGGRGCRPGGSDRVGGFIVIASVNAGLALVGGIRLVTPSRHATGQSGLDPSASGRGNCSARPTR